MQNPSNFTRSLENLSDLENFYQNIGDFGGQMGNIRKNMTKFNERMIKIGKKMSQK